MAKAAIKAKAPRARTAAPKGMPKLGKSAAKTKGGYKAARAPARTAATRAPARSAKRKTA